MMSPENFNTPKIETPILENEDRRQLSNEKIENILEKTTDINAPGTAFSVVDSYYPDEWKDKVDKFNRELSSPPSFDEWFKDNFSRQNEPYKWELTEGQVEIRNPIWAYGDYIEYINATIEDEEARIKMEDLINKMHLPIDTPISEEDFLKIFKAIFSEELNKRYINYVAKRDENLKEKFYGQDFETFKSEYERKLNYSDPRYSAYLSIHNSESLFERYENFREEFDYYGGRAGSGKRSLEGGYYLSHVDSELLEKLGIPTKYSGDNKPKEIPKKEFLELFGNARKEEQNVEKAYKKYHEDYDEDYIKEKGLIPLRSILTHGIFGGRRWRSSGPNALTGYSEGPNQVEPLIQTPEAYVQDIRTKDDAERRRKERHVFFNIVGQFHNKDVPHGRDYPRHPLEYEELKSMKMKDCYWIKNNSVSIIFDKKGMEYTTDDPRLSTPRSEHGYAGPSRVAPRKFLGIVVSCSSLEKCQRAANDIAQAMLDTNTTDSDRLIPIYDISGNMLWPKNIAYEEIKTKHLE